MSSNTETISYSDMFNKQYWYNRLGRQLNSKEIDTISDLKSEIMFNSKLIDIFNSAQKDELHIPFLTKMHGNCIFESLQYYGLCRDIENFRSGLAFIMLAFKNYKNFIPDQELTLMELFGFYNEVDLVFCKKKEILYKYSYDTMCIDLANDSSWHRLNTELIFTIMCIILNVKFVIYHDNGHKSVIKSIEDKDTFTIYLGLIREIHYIPLDKNRTDVTYKCPEYDEAKKEFTKWYKSIKDK